MSKCRRESWDKEETDYLLRLIHERQILKSLDGKRFRAEEIFHHLESAMHARGYLKSAKQMQTRFKTLRFKFNQYKRKMRISGEGNLRREFPFYAAMEVLLGNRPVATLEGIDSASPSSQSESSSSPGQDESTNTSNQSDEASQADDLLDEDSNDETVVVVNEPVEVTTPTGSNTNNVTPSRRVKTARKSTEKSLEKFAELCQQRQDAASDSQEQFISQLFQSQRDFEQQLMTQFFDHQSQMMKDITSSLLHGLRGLFQPTFMHQYSQHSNRHGQGCQCPECL